MKNSRRQKQQPSVMQLPKEITAARFKATCLKLMDAVQTNRTSIVITKRGKPVAKLVPIEDGSAPVFGYMAGTIKVDGDIVSPIATKWDAEA